jgi:hypothetical protein
MTDIGSQGMVGIGEFIGREVDMSDKEVLWRKISLKTQLCYILVEDGRWKAFLQAQKELAELVRELEAA